ncbi:hypothetical protein RFI_37840 [Reticulomyxa filosa]|uniref:Uncharacterized protein n=1 Tax=Reticulomyxa filosa TaxID=46433 RepID=X6LE24_RETFI|nr:hypothetical protein RFI_37840 [Reticulomyxa filosa]|eukprot:ETN99630.1 hypothetical protein RFI_37840 [Reticulomyxa filosa]
MRSVNIIVLTDYLNELIQHYKNHNQFVGTGYQISSRHYIQLEKELIGHIHLFWDRFNIPTLLQACKDNLHWKETVFFLYSLCLLRDLHKHPLLLSELLNELSERLDRKSVVKTVDTGRQLPLKKRAIRMNKHKCSHLAKMEEPMDQAKLTLENEINQIKKLIKEYNEERKDNEQREDSRVTGCQTKIIDLLISKEPSQYMGIDSYLKNPKKGYEENDTNIILEQEQERKQ